MGPPVPHGARGVDDEVSLPHPERGGDFRIARRAAVKLPAGVKELRPRRAVYRTVNPAPAEERGVRGVHYRPGPDIEHSRMDEGSGNPPGRAV